MGGEEEEELEAHLLGPPARSPRPGPWSHEAGGRGGQENKYPFGRFREISYLETSESFPDRFARARVRSELGLLFQMQIPSTTKQKN